MNKLTQWPDDATATIAELCLPISSALESPRGEPHDSQGHAMAPAQLEANAERVRLSKLKPPRGGKWE